MLSLYTVCFNSVSTFLMPHLKSLSSKSNIWALSGTVSLDFFFFSIYGPYFAAFCKFCNTLVLLRTGHQILLALVFVVIAGDLFCFSLFLLWLS